VRAERFARAAMMLRQAFVIVDSAMVDTDR
jgi:hypothetical protein